MNRKKKKEENMAPFGSQEPADSTAQTDPVSVSKEAGTDEQQSIGLDRKHISNYERSIRPTWSGRRVGGALSDQRAWKQQTGSTHFKYSNKRRRDEETSTDQMLKTMW